MSRLQQRSLNLIAARGSQPENSLEGRTSSPQFDHPCFKEFQAPHGYTTFQTMWPDLSRAQVELQESPDVLEYHPFRSDKVDVG
jgi:hypothetical protein